MALSFASGNITITNGTGAQSVTGLSFQPKVVILYWDKASTANAFDADSSFGFAVAVDRATDQFAAVRIFNDDNVATTDSSVQKVVVGTSGFIKIIQNTADSGVFTGSFTSFNADGFTINKDSNDNISSILKYIVLGGTDITNAYLAEFTAPSSAISQAYTGVGFQGNLAIFFGIFSQVTGVSSGADLDWFLGAANGTQQGAVAVWGNDGSGSVGQAESYITSSKCLAIPDGGSLRIDTLADFTSFDADGFTLNFTTVLTSSNRFFCLILDGTFLSHIGQQARPTSTGSQNYTTPNFQTTGVMLAGTFATANATETAEGHLSLGAYDGAGNHGVWIGDAGTINTDCNMYNSNANCYTQATNPSTVAAQAAGTSLLSNGYQLNWTTTDANARLFMHIALGSGSSGPISLGISGSAGTGGHGTSVPNFQIPL